MKRDITVVLTCHSEGTLVHRTLRALEKAKQYAEARGATVEILAVLDRPTAKTKEYFSSPDIPKRWDRVVISDCGDAGMARNFGVTQAAGDYIAIWDGDDIVCENWLGECFTFLKSVPHPENSVLHSQWLLTFGRYWAAWQQFSQDDPQCYISNYLTHNYWSALCFAHRSVFEKVPYVYADHTKGFGFEDMHWNCETLALGYHHYAVPETTHFVRLKETNSRNLTHMQNRVVVMASRLFSPEIFPKYYSPAPVAETSVRPNSNLQAFRDSFEVFKQEWKNSRKAGGSGEKLRRGRTLFAFNRMMYYLLVKPVLNLCPPFIVNVFWKVCGPIFGKTTLTKSNLTLPEFIFEQMRVVSEIEPELFPSDTILRVIPHVPVNPRDTIVAPAYSAMLTALHGTTPRQMVLLPDKPSEAELARCETFIREELPHTPVLIFGLRPEWTARFQAPDRDRYYVPMSAPYGLEDKLSVLLCRAILQFSPTDVHLFPGDLSTILIRNFGFPISNVTRLHLNLSKTEDRFLQSKVYSAFYHHTHRLSSLSLPDGTTKEWLESMFGNIETQVSLPTA
jgi:hypothetical protein